MLDLFARSFRYEARAESAINEAAKTWDKIDAILLALEWAVGHDPAIGPLLFGNVRGFVYPGVRGMNEPDIDVIYEDCNPLIVVHDLTFRPARAFYAGHG